MLEPHECPAALQRWANSQLLRRVGDPASRRGVRRYAGWRWDGVSDEVVFLLSPKGHRMEPIPAGVQRRMRGER